jgi:hypothetical protein
MIILIRISIQNMSVDQLELASNLEIILEKEVSDLQRNYATYTIEESKEGNIINYPNAETMIELFSIIQNDTKLKSFYLNALINKIISSNEVSYGNHRYVGISPICFYVMVKLGFVNEAIDALKKRRTSWYVIYNLIYHLISENYFDKSQLKEISDKLKASSFYFLNEQLNLHSMIVNSRYELLRKQLTKVNIEINQDKKVVSDKISLFGFDNSYKELLDGIDDFINAETPKIVNAGMVNNLRTFLGNLLRDIANKIAGKMQEEIPKIDGCSEMGNVRNYLQKTLELSKKENKFIDAFIDILHSEGGHSFASDKEYFRLARNIAIEIALFVLSKYEKKTMS